VSASDCFYLSFYPCYFLSLTDAQYRALEVLSRRVKERKLRLFGDFFSLRSQGVLRVVYSDTISYKR
jgi:hypothetical protein